MTSTPAKVASLLAIVAGVIMIVAGAATWALVTSQLSAQNITVAGDSPMLPGADVRGPFSAYAQAQIIDTHALDASEGRTYAELGGLINQAQDAGDTALAEELQTQRNTVMNASFLRASLFTSVVSYGVAALVIGLGVVVIMLGWGLRSLARGVDRNAVVARGASQPVTA